MGAKTAKRGLVSRHTFGTTIRLLRGRRSMDEVELATGIPKSALSRWERGLVWPEVDRLTKLCDYLEVTPNQVLGYDPLPDDSLTRAWLTSVPQSLSA